jgi:cobalt-precorrin-7 (C5)-methyltransferase
MSLEIMPVLDVVGIGPGNSAYLTLAGRDLIAQADVVAGFRTVLAVVAEHIRGEQVVLDYRNQVEGMTRVAAALQEGKRAVLCAHGDANFSGQELVLLARQTCGMVRLMPGISSVQIACARAGLAMEETLFITFHKRADITNDQAELAATVVGGRRNVITLPRPWDFMPAALARFLLAEGAAGAQPVTVYERLTLEGEAAHTLTLSELAERAEEFSDLSIVVIPRRE